jgi:hypothetical protein
MAAYAFLSITILTPGNISLSQTRSIVKTGPSQSPPLPEHHSAVRMGADKGWFASANVDNRKRRMSDQEEVYYRMDSGVYDNRRAREPLVERLTRSTLAERDRRWMPTSGQPSLHRGAQTLTGGQSQRGPPCVAWRAQEAFIGDPPSVSCQRRGPPGVAGWRDKGVAAWQDGRIGGRGARLHDGMILGGQWDDRQDSNVQSKFQVQVKVICRMPTLKIFQVMYDGLTLHYFFVAGQV